jgi:tetratricopeptide (TPR) repeat protein
MFFQTAFTRGDQALEQAADLLKNTSLANSIGAPEKTVAVSEQVSAAAEKLKDLSPSAASTYGISTAAIARANLFSGDAKQAVEAYRTSIACDPWNPRLRFEFARALQSAGASGTEMMMALPDALAIEPQKPDPDLRRKIYESLTYVALYQPEPDGFTQAIFYGTAYTAEPGNLPSAVIWVNLAAAYGQQARWNKAHEGHLDGLVRSRALDAAREAVRLDSEQKAFLASLLRGDRPGEDDLAVFKDDREFRNTLGLPELEG